MSDNNTLHYGKGIPVTSGFDLGAKSPLDSRMVVDNFEELQLHIDGNRAYEGMLVYVNSEKKLYVYNGTDWEELTTNMDADNPIFDIIDNLELVKSSEEEPTEENVSIWINTSYEAEYCIVPRINDETVASSTTWSSEKINNQILNAALGGGGNGTVDLSGYATKTELTNYATKSQLSTYATKVELNSYYSKNEVDTTLKNYATIDYVDEAISSVNSGGNTNSGGNVNLDDYALKTDLHSHSNKMVLDEITDSKINEWDNKSNFSGSYNDLTDVPNIPSITNDLTDTLKSNYDEAYQHSLLQHAPSNAQPNSEITKTEIENKLTGNITTHTHSQYLTEHQSLSNYATKQYVIDSINNASLGGGGEVNLENYAKLTDIPTKTSNLINDSGFLTQVPSEYVTETELNSKGYLTEHQSLENYATKNYVTDAINNASLSGGDVNLDGYAKLTDIPTKVSQLENDSSFLTEVPTEYITETELEGKGYLTEHQNISHLALKTELHGHNNKGVLDGITSEKVNEWNNKSNFSGNYNDLTNKPSIPSEYVLPEASSTTLGGVKVGAGLSITNGVLSAVGGGVADSVDWSNVQNKPTIPTKTSDLTNDTGFLTEHQSLNGYAKLTDIPTKTSDLTNDSGFLTEHQNISHLALKTDIPTKTSDLTNDTGFLTQVPSEYITETELNGKGYLTQQSLSNYAQKSDLHSHTNKTVLDGITSSKVTEWDNKSNFSGSYNDLTNKPTIPTIPSSLPANGGNANTVGGYSIWVGTQSQYDAIGTKSSTTIYMIRE